MLSIIGYTLTVKRGARAGLVKNYGPGKRAAARNFADQLDLEYGAICAHVAPVWDDSSVPKGWAFAETSTEA